MCTCQCTWGHDCTGSGCSQELFPYVYVTLGVVTSVQKDWEGMGCVREREREREIYISPWLQVHITGPRHHLASSLRILAQGI